MLVEDVHDDDDGRSHMFERFCAKPLTRMSLSNNACPPFLGLFLWALSDY